MVIAAVDDRDVERPGRGPPGACAPSSPRRAACSGRISSARASCSAAAAAAAGAGAPAAPLATRARGRRGGRRGGEPPRLAASLGLAVDESELDERMYVNVDGDGRDGAVPAGAAGEVELVAELLRRGADIDHETQRKHTALTWCAVCGRVDVLDALLAAGADLHRTTADRCNALTHAAAPATRRR